MFKQIQMNGMLYNVWNVGPYTIEQIPNDQFSFIAGSDGVNCVTMAMDKVRVVFDAYQVQLFFNELNKPVDTQS